MTFRPDVSSGSLLATHAPRAERRKGISETSSSRTPLDRDPHFSRSFRRTFVLRESGWASPFRISLRERFVDISRNRFVARKANPKIKQSLLFFSLISRAGARPVPTRSSRTHKFCLSNFHGVTQERPTRVRASIAVRARPRLCVFSVVHRARRWIFAYRLTRYRAYFLRRRVRSLSARF